MKKKIKYCICRAAIPWFMIRYNLIDLEKQLSKDYNTFNYFFGVEMMIGEDE